MINMASVTVIMPAHNAAATIRQSITSVLAQTAVTELIIIDDKSTDETAKIARAQNDNRIVIIPGPGLGISAALNCGFQAASGEFIARCDADDLFVEGRLEWQLAWLCNHDDYIAVSAGYQTITHSGASVADLACDGNGRDIAGKLLAGEAVTHFCTWLLRTSAILTSGGCRTWFATAEDLDIQFRLAQQGKIWHEPKVSYFYRLHDNSITHTQNTKIKEFYETCSKTFAVQRAEHGTDDLENGTPPPLPTVSSNHVTTSSQQITSQLVGSAWNLHRNGEKWAGIKQMLKAIMIKPFNLSLWKGLVAIIAKSTG
jgi:glycosyltransferase involved in cell wall biosynthesis